MTPDLAPVQLRLASMLLRQHRLAARWTLEEAAAELACDKSKISRIETGHRRPVLREMQQLLAAYGVTGRERQAIAALTGAARAGWWSEYRGLLPDAMVDHAMLESIADDVMVYEPQALPPFLQTYSYAAAVSSADPALQTDEERRTAVLLAARRAASTRERPYTAFTVILGEAALRQQVGASEAMLDQLRRLAARRKKSPCRSRSTSSRSPPAPTRPSASGLFPSCGSRTCQESAPSARAGATPGHWSSGSQSSRPQSGGSKRSGSPRSPPTNRSSSSAR